MSERTDTPRVEPALTLDGVRVVLAGREVLHEVSFALAPNELAGLIGTNGAGKTTLLRAILGLAPVAAGEIHISGGPSASGARAIGYVPQKVVLDPDLPLRARDVVGLGLDGHRLGVPLPSRRRRAQVDELLEAVDARHLAEARVGELSGGEQQRVLIAHALVGRPRLLLLDEPLANLDLGSAAEVVALVAKISRDQGVAVLVSAHDMNPLLPVMDRIVYVANGRVVAGSVDEVVQPEVLSRLYGQHVDVVRVHDRVLVIAESTGDTGAAPHHDDEFTIAHREEQGR